MDTSRSPHHEKGILPVHDAQPTRAGAISPQADGLLDVLATSPSRARALVSRRPVSSRLHQAQDFVRGAVNARRNT
eukprot:scaffold7055_cov254-Pinguiococcus_pyrenoidosus.AAC.10